MNLHSIERNSAQLGRLFAGLLAVILVTVIPLRGLARRSAEAQESYIEACLNSFVDEVAATHTVTLPHYELFLEQLAGTGVLLDCEITVIRHLKALENDDIYDAGYTDEVLKRLYSDGEYILDGQDMITVRLVCRKESTAMRVSHLFSSASEVQREYISGWKADG